VSLSWLVIHPGALGDVLLALPALAHLGRLAAGGRRVLAALPRVAALLDGSAHVEATVDFDALGLHELFVAEPDPAVPDRLRGYSGIVSWFGAAEPTYRAHLEGLGRPLVVARAAPPRGSGMHAAHHLLASLAPLGPVPDALPAARLEAGGPERRWADAWLAARGLRTGEAVVLHPGAGSPAKAWPGFGRLARRLAAGGVPVVVIGGPADARTVARAVEDGGVADAMVLRDASLRQLTALFEQVRGFVGNDSGLSHLAAAVGCPSLVLFGPTDPVLWRPLGKRVVVLGGAAAGAPDPWRELGVDRVEDALGSMLRTQPALAGRGWEP